MRVYRGWRDDPGLLPAVRELFTYDPGDRANGYLFLDDGGQEWPPSFAGHGARLLADLELLLSVRFTIVVFQAYRDGSGVGWHADDVSFVQAILSLGDTRTFGVRPIGADGPGEPEWMKVHHGDLIVMPAGFQRTHEHCVPVEDVTGERVSLVFRAVQPSRTEADG